MTKKLEDFNFKNYGIYNIDNIKSHVINFSDEWFIDTSRQEKYATHKNTNSYFLYESDLEWNNTQEFLSQCKSDNKELLNLVEPIIKTLEEIHDGVRGNVLVINLKAGTNIAEHRDNGYYLDRARRHHIPIITSDQTWFSVGSEKINMLEGECWEINNTRLHAVENNSDIDRIHLLIDIMPNTEIGKK
jgi:hypothetical protein